MRVQHPVAKAEDGVVDDAVYVAGDEVPIDDDGTFEVPEQARSWLSDWAAGYGMEPDDLIVTQEGPPPDAETCSTVKTDGEVCGRDLPCPYHSDSEEM